MSPRGILLLLSLAVLAAVVALRLASEEDDRLRFSADAGTESGSGPESETGSGQGEHLATTAAADAPRRIDNPVGDIPAADGPIADRIAELDTVDRRVWEIRVEALARRLREIEAHAPEVSALAEALTHTSRATREGAAHVLGEIGTRAIPAIDPLIVAIEDDDDFVRWKAIRALARIGSPASRARDAIRPILDAERETAVIRAWAENALDAFDTPRAP